jgi:hypothetical protein
MKHTHTRVMVVALKNHLFDDTSSSSFFVERKFCILTAGILFKTLNDFH